MRFNQKSCDKLFCLECLTPRKLKALWRVLRGQPLMYRCIIDRLWWDNNNLPEGLTLIDVTVLNTQEKDGD